MKIYQYSAIDTVGKTVVGLVRAESMFQANHKIKAQKLTPISVELRTSFFAKFNSLLSFGGISVGEKSATYQKMATMLKAGIPIIRALRVVSQTDNQTLKKSIVNIIKDVEQGKTVSASCAGEKHLFNTIDISLIGSGEATGNIDKVFARMADEKAKESRLRKKLQSALIYPVILVLVIIGVIVIMIKNVVPVLQEVFAESDAHLPRTTQTLVDFTNFINSYWWLIIMILIALIAICLMFFRITLIGKYLWSFIKLRTPIFGSIHKDIALEEICNCLALLISSGVPIIQAVQLTSGVTGNEIYHRAFKKIADELEKGVPVSASLEAYNYIFPSIVSNMVSAGEESGTIDLMLANLAGYYEDNADNKIKSLSSALEPAMVVMLGLAVGYVVMAVMVPIYNMSQIYQ